jgi:hypothetical protein
METFEIIIISLFIGFVAGMLSLFYAFAFNVNNILEHNGLMYKSDCGSNVNVATSYMNLEMVDLYYNLDNETEVFYKNEKGEFVKIK